VTERPDFVAIAREGWNGAPPDWVLRLAEECQETSQRRAAQRIGRSDAAVSGVLRNTYGGSLTALEELVRGALMSETVDCPALGHIGTNTCAAWRAKARNFSGHNRLRVQMFHACKGCPVYRRTQA
jgi:hypothetical protein